MNVLIVDDSKPILTMVSEMLKELGHTPLTALDGLEAAKVIADQSVDAVLLDWNMPNMTGLEFLEKNSQESFCKCPIVMMTTEKAPEKIQKALSLGAVEYIMKPFTADILENKLEMASMLG